MYEIHNWLFPLLYLYSGSVKFRSVNSTGILSQKELIHVIANIMIKVNLAHGAYDILSRIRLAFIATVLKMHLFYNISLFHLFFLYVYKNLTLDILKSSEIYIVFQTSQ
jgi:hypothetical protein